MSVRNGILLASSTSAEVPDPLAVEVKYDSIVRSLCLDWLMDAKSALKIVKALADGADPETGEILPSSSCIHQPQTVRALHLALKALNTYVYVDIDKTSRRNGLPTNAGLAWSEEEDGVLCAKFDAGVTLQQLAVSHERTAGAIRSRLMRLGKMKVPIYS